MHAPIAPSAMSRIMACPGSVAMCVDIPNKSSKYAEEGTQAHELAESWLLFPKTLTRTHGAEMMRAVQTYVDIVLFLEDVCGGQRQLEQLVRYSDEIYGTADAIIVSADGKSMHVIDYKHGAGLFVGAEGNMQLLTYAVAALRTLPGGRKIETVTGSIVQPRCGDEPWRTVTWTRDQLRDWSRQLDAVEEEVASALKGEKLHPGAEQCRWCPAAATCPALRERSLALTKEAFADTPVERNVEALTADQLGRILPDLDLVEAWAKAIRSEAHARAEAGAPPTGYKLVERVGIRAWVPGTDVAGRLRAMGIDPHSDPVLLSPAKAEKALLALGVARKVVLADVAPMTEKPRKGATLVPNSDRRTALTRGAKVFLTD